MRFAHISDLHLCQNPAAIEGLRNDTPAVVQAVARDVAAISDSLDCVIVSGDLTDDADEASFGEFERLFAEVGAPVFTIPGNHDGPGAYHLRKARSDFLAQSDLSGRLVQVGGVRFFGMDTNVEGRTSGAHDPHVLERLADVLKAPETTPLVVVMHHPPFLAGQKTFNEICETDGGDDFARLIRDSARKPIVLCGHVHRPYVASFEGAYCFVGGTPTAPFSSERPFGDLPIRPSWEPYAYFVHQIDASGHHVVTTRAVMLPDTSGQELRNSRNA